MNRLARINPTQTGIILFVIAAGALLATIACSALGQQALAKNMLKAAEPTCAAAIAVLVYLGMAERATASVEVDED